MIFWPNYRYTDLIPYGPETEDQYSSRGTPVTAMTSWGPAWDLGDLCGFHSAH